MARFKFGGGALDFAFATVQISGRDVMSLPGSGKSLTFWDAETGGAQYTDLLLDGAAVSSVPISSDGSIPEFEGPDGVSVLWADGGDGRVKYPAILTVPELNAALSPTFRAALVWPTGW